MKLVPWFLALALWSVPVELPAQTRAEVAVEAEPTLRIGDGLNEGPDRSFTDIAAISLIGDSILVLEWPTAMWLGPEGVTVVDLKLRRQSLFSRQGELIRTEKLGALAGQPLAGSAQLRGGVAVVETAISMSSEGGAFPERLIIVMNAQTPAADTIAQYSTGYVPFRTPESFGSSQPVQVPKETGQ